jgi:putative tricarboxylic transport membrane protein
MNERAMTRADFLMALALLALGLAVVWGAWSMDRLEVRRIHPASAPGVVPGMLGIALLVCGGLLLTRSIRAGGHHPLAVSEGLGAWLRTASAARLGGSLLLMLVYPLVLVGRMPFAVATAIFVFAFIALFEWQPRAPPRRKALGLLTALAQAVLVGAVVAFVFQELFLVRLP